jgi:type VI secretion system protein ImpH
VADRQSHFRLVIGPLEMRQYLRFTPGDDRDALRGRDLRALVEAVRAFVGFEYAWDVELRVLPHEVPVARLGGTERLGWSSWLAGRRTPTDESIAGLVFSPEDYLARPAPSRRAATHETST